MQTISSILNDHKSFFSPSFKDNYGLLELVKNDYTILVDGEVYVHKDKDYIPEKDIGNHARNMQYVTFERNKEPITVMNFHGLWSDKGKCDTEDRIMQSKNIINFIKTLKGEVILFGDFNLLPDTESIKIIENSGLINLIKKYNIKSTRTSFYTKSEKFADYCFVSKGIKVKKFRVLEDEVSDHSALELEIE